MGRVVKRLAQPGIAEIAEQQEPSVEVAGEDRRGGQPGLAQPVGNRGERARILVRRGRVHQHRSAAFVDNAEVTAERGVPGERQDARPAPAVGGEESRGTRRRNHG